MDDNYFKQKNEKSASETFPRHLITENKIILLNYKLNKRMQGHSLTKSHENFNKLMYMYKFIKCCKDEKEQKTFIQKTRNLFYDVEMEFNSKKCTLVKINNDQSEITEAIELSNKEIMQKFNIKNMTTNTTVFLRKYHHTKKEKARKKEKKNTSLNSTSEL